RPRRGAQVLTAQFHFHRSIRMDRGTAFTIVAETTPGADSKSEPPFHDTASRVAPLMPVLFPIDHARGDVELLGVNFRTIREAQVLLEQLDRIHLQLGGQILKCRAGYEGDLRM